MQTPPAGPSLADAIAACTMRVLRRLPRPRPSQPVLIALGLTFGIGLGLLLILL